MIEYKIWCSYIIWYILYCNILWYNSLSETQYSQHFNISTLQLVSQHFNISTLQLVSQHSTFQHLHFVSTFQHFNISFTIHKLNISTFRFLNISTFNMLIQHSTLGKLNQTSFIRALMGPYGPHMGPYVRGGNQVLTWSV